MILVDTDVLIDALRGREPSLGHIRRGLRQDALATTTITLFELASGAHDEVQARSIADLLAAMRLVPFDVDAAHASGEIRRRLEGEGMKIGMADYLIAGVAISRSWPLLTRNRKHFERVPDLRLADDQ